jgi:VanZ family protein
VIRKLLRHTKGLTLVAALMWVGAGVMAVRPGHANLAPSWDGLDKVMHFGAFAAMSAALWWALVRARRWSPVKATWVVWLTAMGYGVAIELVQLAVPYRTAEFWDVVADAVGVLVGVEVARRLERWVQSWSNRSER